MMALDTGHLLNDDPHDERRQEILPILSACPICDGTMEIVYTRNNQQVIVCTDCHSGLTVPSSAWDVARAKKRLPNP
jgi:ssDNA-binding Zn-finger/Zn-ribbon topoisomerase 1